MAGERACTAPVLDEQLLDALREVASIGCGHAATALSKMIGGQRVEIEVPRANVVGCGQVVELVGRREDPMVAVAFDLSGDLAGTLLLLLHRREAAALASALLAKPVAAGALGPEARSALSEVGNILGSVCLSAISRTCGLRLLPSPPRLAEDRAEALLGEAVGALGKQADRALVLETRFHAGEEAALSGHFLILPEVGSLGRLQRAIGQ